MDSPPLSISDIGSSASNFRGPMSAYNPYPTYPTYPTYPSYPRRYYGSYGAPSTVMSYYPSAYSGYAPSATYSNYSDARYSSTAYNTGGSTERVYFSYNGKLVRSYKIRSYRRAQKHVLDLFPDMLQGIASSRIQFYVVRPGYSSRGRYIGLRSYISKNAWPTEMDSLAEHETIGIEIRPSVSFTESVASFFNRSRFM